MTGWVILRHEEANLWRQITAIVAETPFDAVQEAVASGVYSAGEYRVIPSESWAAVVHVAGDSLLAHAARELVDAVRAHDPELVSNDLGNALDAVEDALGGRA